MPTKSLLINYVGCPSSLDSFIPDNGLANLAGSLLANGHKTEILDYATIQTLKDFRPKYITRALKGAFLRYKLETFLFGRMSSAAYKAFREIDTKIESIRNEKIKKIAEEIENKIKIDQIDFIAFKLWTGAGFIGSSKIAEILKKRHPQLKIFAGGPHVEVFGKLIFSHTSAFDVLCQCEGEEVIVALAQFAEGKKNLHEIHGLIYKEDSKIKSTPVRFIENLDSIAEPVYEESIYPAMKGNEKIKILMLDESRGCPYSCNFCIHRIKSGNRWRLRSVDKVINTLVDLSRKYNTNTFKFAGSNTPYFFRKELAERLISTHTKIRYIGFADTRQPEEEDYALLKESGCVSLFFGVESADPYLLDNIINKNSDPELMRNSLKKAREAGILTAASIIVPCPGETEESIRKTVALLTEAKPHGVSIYPGFCYPKTKWFLESKKFGFELPEDAEKKAMLFTMKFTMPPPLLPPFPFKVDGKDSHAILSEVMETSKQLEKNGITATMNDSLLLIGNVLKLSPKKIKKLNQESMILGACEKLQEKITAFNSGVRL